MYICIYVYIYNLLYYFFRIFINNQLSHAFTLCHLECLRCCVFHRLRQEIRQLRMSHYHQDRGGDTAPSSDPSDQTMSED